MRWLALSRQKAVLGFGALIGCSALFAAPTAYYQWQFDKFSYRNYYDSYPRHYARTAAITADTSRKYSHTCSSFSFADPADYSYVPGSVPTALASYPGSGSTLTRLLLEVATEIYTGSVYGDVSLYNNTAHRFLGEFHLANVSCVKTHYPVGPTHGPEFQYRDAERAAIILRDPRLAVPSYLNYQYGLERGDDHGIQAPLEVWEAWRDEPARVVTEVKGWINITKHWAHRMTHRLSDDNLYVVMYEDLVGRDTGVGALSSLISFLGYSNRVTDEAIRCALEEILGEDAKGRGIRRQKEYVPSYSQEQDAWITAELQAFAEWSGQDNAHSSLGEAIRSYVR